jgi:cyclase
MLKVRVMPTLLFKDLGLVKGIRFNSWRRVGSVMQAVKVYNLREVDELIFLDISATSEMRSPDFETVDEIADECFMPLTVGGGVRKVEHAIKLLQVGADKISLNTAAIEYPGLVRELAEELGSQCVVVSIDVKQQANGSYEVFTHAGTRATGKDPITWSQEAEQLGAGEILLTSIDRDGTMKGYDLEVTRRLSEAVSIPVIASGGAGNYEHLASVLIEGKASAVAAASIFHYTQQTPLEAKKFLRDRGIKVRI